ncbi:hypothetical protein HR17_05820 [Porphyromonas gulae]|uniref:Uncharacterized protein n=1 Tax=Porphyromonas gulae TaxID=111105 RepID=A0A099WXG1_9PORP|nr:MULTISPECIES: hypothetical protein [Porphyromonas]KGL48870.1 hypothetical protein HQ49_03450 [Porphyromonas gulae]KGL54145.1 hypothetical protein HQ50_10320 [Porphyromonas sp. COT-052 OH4946]KGN68710.1 hypothetical protein HR09_06910 [Porphyromonas gulae]KGN74296.1 hypothetical protein HR17_05820 [Porphyromonas gulae]KGN75309.1 hypothetical protein HQ40_06550 [Porphyromonas gulae]
MEVYKNNDKIEIILTEDEATTMFHFVDKQEGSICDRIFLDSDEEQLLSDLGLELGQILYG